MKVPANEPNADAMPPDQFNGMMTPRGKKKRRVHLGHLTGQRHADRVLMGALNPPHPMEDTEPMP